MSRRITVTVPDDIAAQLDEQVNVSAYVASAVAARLTRDRAHAHQADHGFQSTPEGRAWAKRALAAADTSHDPQAYAELRSRLGL